MNFSGVSVSCASFLASWLTLGQLSHETQFLSSLFHLLKDDPMRIRGIHCPLSYLVVVVVERGTLRFETLRFETPYLTHGPPHLRCGNSFDFIL